MEINIRSIKREDCDRLLQLIRELAIYERAPGEVTVSMEEFEEAGFGSKPVWKGFVAEVDGIIQGMALYYIRYSTWKGCRLYLEDLVVTEKMRGNGIGKLLFDRVVLEAHNQGMKGLNWQVLDWNEPAINFYRKYDAAMDGSWINGSLSEDQLKEHIEHFKL